MPHAPSINPPRAPRGVWLPLLISVSCTGPAEPPPEGPPDAADAQAPDAQASDALAPDARAPGAPGPAARDAAASADAPSDAFFARDAPPAPPDVAGPSPDARAGGADALVARDGPTAACPQEAFLCEGFEGHRPDAAPGAPWRASTYEGAVVVSEARPFGGARALRATVAPGAGYRRAFVELTGAPVFPAAATGLFGRMMIWTAALPPSAVHFDFIEAEGRLAGTTTDAVYRYGGMGKLLANYSAWTSQGLTADCAKGSGASLPVARWTCVEWQFDGARNALRFWMDGQPVDALAVEGKGDTCVGGKEGGDGDGIWRAPPFSALRLGWQHHQTSSTPVELWIDDVAVAPRRLGCPAAPKP